MFFRNVEVTDVRFPALDEKLVAQMDKLFKELIPKSRDPISIDRIMADLSQTKTPSKGVAVKYNFPLKFIGKFCGK